MFDFGLNFRLNLILIMSCFAFSPKSVFVCFASGSLKAT